MKSIKVSWLSYIMYVKFDLLSSTAKQVSYTIIAVALIVADGCAA